MANVLNKKINYLVLLLFLIITIKNYAQDLPEGFVYLKNVIPSIEVEMRYFGNNNFIGEQINGYSKAKAIVTKETAIALNKVQKELEKQNLGLKIYDAFRPQVAVDHFVSWAKILGDTIKKNEFYPNVHKKDLFKEHYISSRSGHSRGSTVDITVIDLSSEKKEKLDMGSPFDFFGKESWVSNPNLTSIQIKNRKILQDVMKKHNFKNYPQEWWHFTLRNEPYPNTYFNFTIE
ncbi:M15 family metallopeptidase [uncultured Lutibacter sp.]|uniref:M15 family metallopeptidase n=1 Tax=uncultured Lutibacter sp. TaxID=437739 RepID=UPI00260E7988|nr:M15 family metallopeptidase [uncultured Lutibacter sp.]